MIENVDLGPREGAAHSTPQEWILMGFAGDRTPEKSISFLSEVEPNGGRERERGGGGGVVSVTSVSGKDLLKTMKWVIIIYHLN